LSEDDESFFISKEVLPSLEGLGFAETILGDPDGSLRQFRNATGIHIREYEDYFEVHKDRIDPRKDPLGHLIRDSPETILALGAASIISNKIPKLGNNSRSDPFDFLNLFLSLHRFFRFLKNLLFF
jgi:hypothetical protein